MLRSRLLLCVLCLLSTGCIATRSWVEENGTAALAGTKFSTISVANGGGWVAEAATNFCTIGKHNESRSHDHPTQAYLVELKVQARERTDAQGNAYTEDWWYLSLNSGQNGNALCWRIGS